MRQCKTFLLFIPFKPRTEKAYSKKLYGGLLCPFVQASPRPAAPHPPATRRMVPMTPHTGLVTAEGGTSLFTGNRNTQEV